jgi:septum formation protein
MEPVILASNSPRRQEYFKLLGIPFNIMAAKLEESPAPGQDAAAYTEDMARRKIAAVLDRLRGGAPPLWICGADTAVSVDGAIFGKPANREDAGTMLETLRGREHEVSTAVALFDGRRRCVDCRTVQSAVSFAPFSDRELEWYLNTGEWQGAAGGYRIQGLGACLVTGIRGSYSAVVGLPLREFYAMLMENGYPFFA